MTEETRLLEGDLTDPDIVEQTIFPTSTSPFPRLSGRILTMLIHGPIRGEHQDDSSVVGTVSAGRCGSVRVRFVFNSVRRVGAVDSPPP